MLPGRGRCRAKLKTCRPGRCKDDVAGLLPPKGSDKSTMAKAVIVLDPAKCAGCMMCMLRCSLRFEGLFRLAAARIKVRKLACQPDEFEIAFTDACDACGVCVRYCPYGALSREKAVKEG